MRKNWLWYQTFRYPIVKFGLNLFYKRIIVRGREHIPRNKPVIFLSNHQNSFMDALLLVTSVRPFIYFLTRAQAFKPAIQGAFISSLNMVPVYRVRDGFSSVSKNKEIFDQCISYLRRNDALLIFPEANHDLRRRVRPLSKGFTRIAFDAELRENWEMDLHLVPLGLNYGDHLRTRNSVRVQFGEPIKMKEFKDLYAEDERKATEELKSRVHEAMKRLTMHVPNLEHYALHHILLDDLEPDQSKLIDPDLVNARVTKIEEKAPPELFELAKELRMASEEEGIPIKQFTQKRTFGMKWLLAPFYLFSWLNNLIPYQPVRLLVKNVIEDHAHDSSIKFLVSLFAFPLFWIIISMVLYAAGVASQWIAGYFILSLCTAVLFKEANELGRITREKRKFKKFETEKPGIFKKMQTGIRKLNEFRSEVFELTKSN